jgi:hypothetical protein
MAADSDIAGVVDDILAELTRDGRITRRRMYEIAEAKLGAEACTDLEGNWAIPLEVLVGFRAERPATARFLVDDEVWILR